MDKLLKIFYYPKKEAIDREKNHNLSMSRKMTPRERVIILHFGYHHLNDTQYAAHGTRNAACCSFSMFLNSAFENPPGLFQSLLSFIIQASL